MCDVNDEMVDVHCSFMVGLVNELCSMQAKLKPEKNLIAGILTLNEC